LAAKAVRPEDFAEVEAGGVFAGEAGGHRAEESLLALVWLKISAHIYKRAKKQVLSTMLFRETLSLGSAARLR
jgi:hypothetical protein